MSQGTDVRAGRTLNEEAREAAFDLLELVLVDFHFDWLQLNRLLFPGQFIGRTPSHFLRGERWRLLLESAGAFRRQTLEHACIQHWRSVRPEWFAVRVVS